MKKAAPSLLMAKFGPIQGAVYSGIHAVFHQSTDEMRDFGHELAHFLQQRRYAADTNGEERSKLSKVDGVSSISTAFNISWL